MPKNHYTSIRNKVVRVPGAPLPDSEQIAQKIQRQCEKLAHTVPNMHTAAAAMVPLPDDEGYVFVPFSECDSESAPFLLGGLMGGMAAQAAQQTGSNLTAGDLARDIAAQGSRVARTIGGEAVHQCVMDGLLEAVLSEQKPLMWDRLVAASERHGVNPRLVLSSLIASIPESLLDALLAGISMEEETRDDAD